MYGPKLHAWLTFLPCAFATSVPEQLTISIHDNAPSAKALDHGIDRFAADLLKKYHVPGISVAIVDLRLDEPVQIESKGYGISNFPSTPATGDTLYFTGSTTKAFTAAAAAKLVFGNDTELKWTSRMNDFLPEDFVLSNGYATTHTTLEDALSHRSGLPRHDLSYGSFETSSIVKRMRNLPLTAEPRTRFQYCNLMFAAVSDLIERVTGAMLGSVLRDWFWNPLGMQSTFFSITDAASDSRDGSGTRLARGYFWVDQPESTQSGRDGYFVPEPYLDLSGISGAGATISSVNDYALWVQALLNAAGSSNSMSNSSSPISSSLWQKVVSSRTIIDTDGFGPAPPPTNRLLSLPPTYALGWINTALLDHVLTYHPGGLPGFGTGVFLLPDQGFGVVTMGNTAETSNTVGTLLALRLLMTRLGEREAEVEKEAQRIHHLSSLTGLSGREFCAGCNFLPNSDLEAVTSLSSCSHRTSQERRPEMESQLGTDLKRFVGVYKHPSYGVSLVMAGNCTEDSIIFADDKERRAAQSAKYRQGAVTTNDQPTCLHVLPLQKTWQYELELRPLILNGRFDNFFSVQAWQPHGPHNVDAILGTLPRCDTSRSGPSTHSSSRSKEECRDFSVVLMASPALSFAHFEINIDGGVDRMGVGLESEMIRAAEAEGGKNGQYEWRNALIWFTRE